MARWLMRGLGFLATSAAVAAEGAEITVCIVDNAVPNNPVYYYLPTTGSVLRCEINRPDYHPTLADLYADGWRLITVLDPKVKTKPGGGERPSPVFYLEKAGATAGKGESSASKDSSSGGNTILKGFF